MASPLEQLKSLPQKPGVYLFKDKFGAIIYIGKARSLRRRVASYFKKSPELKTSILLGKLSKIDYIVTGSELDALVLESELIKEYKPRYNVALRDDKAYPFLKLTVNEEWPRLFLARKKEKDGALYFGRFQGSMVREVIRLAKKFFPIRWCKESPLRNREQPCLYYRIGSCAGPCIGRIKPEDYQNLVHGIRLLLRGKTGAAVAKLKEEMQKAAAEHAFERAAFLRDRIRLLEKMFEGKKGFGCAPALLRLPSRRIEAFDISNIQGSNIVGAMVAFVGGAPLKRDYRRFKIRSVAGKPNDVRAIYEVVKRRYAGSLAKKMELPDLIMVDGGPGQVNAGQRALEEAKVSRPIIGLAKKEELLYSPGKKNPLRLPRHSPELQLLQRVRDEAHRFAVNYHREKRRRGLFG